MSKLLKKYHDTHIVHTGDPNLPASHMQCPIVMNSHATIMSDHPKTQTNIIQKLTTHLRNAETCNGESSNEITSEFFKVVISSPIKDGEDCSEA